MTKENLLFKIQTKTPFEFSYNGRTYNLTYDQKKDKNGNSRDVIVFGVLYEGKIFDSYGDFMNNAKVENHFFREMLDLI